MQLNVNKLHLPIFFKNVEAVAIRMASEDVRRLSQCVLLIDVCTRQKGKVALMSAMKAYREVEVVYPPAHTLAFVTHHTADSSSPPTTAHFLARPMFNARSPLRQPVAVNAERAFPSAAL